MEQLLILTEASACKYFLFSHCTNALKLCSFIIDSPDLSRIPASSINKRWSTGRHTRLNLLLTRAVAKEEVGKLHKTTIRGCVITNAFLLIISISNSTNRWLRLKGNVTLQNTNLLIAFVVRAANVWQKKKELPWTGILGKQLAGQRLLRAGDKLPEREDPERAFGRSEF